ncbi:MAG: HAD hydrolase family protein [Nitrospira sp.]|nr:HAD hydrolase family protein [Nitrospira sp.]
MNKKTSPRTSTRSRVTDSRLVKARLRRIRLFATDVDGVLTDAGMYYSESGDEWKKFNTRDGMGIKLLQKAGLITAIVTQERTRLVARRAEKLTIPEVHQGVMDKLSMIRDMASRYGLTLGQVAYIGDDVNDLEALKAVGFSASPADGMPQVLRAVDYVCRKKGGEGAVREVVEMILEAQHPLDGVKHGNSRGTDSRKRL